eukprot:763715-Hanusia_phi.AAC.1
MGREISDKFTGCATGGDATKGFNASAALVKATMIHSAQVEEIEDEIGKSGGRGGVCGGTRSSRRHRRRRKEGGPGNRTRGVGAWRRSPAKVQSSSGQWLYPSTVPNIQTGYGRIDLSQGLSFADSPARSIFLDREKLGHGEELSLCVAASSSVPFKATLVWTDPAGQIMAERVLVNDLDLVVQSEQGDLWMGNNLTQADETYGEYAVRDDLQNAEQVREVERGNGSGGRRGGSGGFGRLMETDFWRREASEHKEMRSKRGREGGRGEEEEGEEEEGEEEEEKKEEKEEELILHQVTLSVPSSGLLMVRVIGKDVPLGPQTFSLVLSGSDLV